MRRFFILFCFCISIVCVSPAFAGGDITYALVTGQVWKDGVKESRFLKWEKYDKVAEEEKLIFPNIRLTFGKLEAGPLLVSLSSEGSSSVSEEEKKPQALFINLYEKNEKSPMPLDDFKNYYESVRLDMDATLGEKGKTYNSEKNVLYWKSLGSDIALVLGLKRTDKGVEADHLRIIATPQGKIDQALKQNAQL